MAALRTVRTPRQKRGRVVVIITFNDNDAGLIEHLHQEFGARLIVFYTANAAAQARMLVQKGVATIAYTAKNLLLGRTIAYLRGASVIVVDNYVAELALVSTRVPVYQIWHAAGAIKQFGWDDPATSKRPAADQRRFQQVYDRFTHIVVGSAKMGQIFQRAYHLSDKHIMTTGFLRSDVYAHLPRRPVQAGTSVLYVPTYRATPAAMTAVLRQAFAAFAKTPSVQVTVKLHPTVDQSVLPALPANVTVTQADLTHLMPSACVLITDYSSAVFEYALIVKDGRTVFFCPDLHEYAQSPGLQPDFADWNIGKLDQTADALAQDLANVESLPRNNAGINEMWNTYNDGYAAVRLFEDIVKTAR